MVFLAGLLYLIGKIFVGSVYTAAPDEPVVKNPFAAVSIVPTGTSVLLQP